MTEDTTLFLIQGMLQNLDEKMARLEKLLSHTSPSLGKEGEQGGTLKEIAPTANSNSADAATSVSEEEKLPVFPAEVYDGLPSLLAEITTHHDTPEERDVLFLSTLVTLSACLPWVQGVYDERVVYTNLFLFISGKASAGKVK